MSFDLTRRAYFQGFPFSPLGYEVIAGQKIAVHEYPFRDGVWAEPMGRKGRVFRITGEIVGDDAAARAQLLRVLVEAPGTSFLYYPEIGLRQVIAQDFSITADYTKMRVVKIQLTVIESTKSPLFEIITDTIAAIIVVTGLMRHSAGHSYSKGIAKTLSPIASNNITNINRAQSQVTRTNLLLSNKVKSQAILLSSSTNAISGINPIIQSDRSLTLSRYSGGNITITPTILSDVDLNADTDTIVASATQKLISNATVQQAQLSAACVKTKQLVSNTTIQQPYVDSVMQLFENFRLTANDPSDQITIIVSYLADATKSIQFANVTAIDYVAALYRRSALTSLALALSTYQPRSSTETNILIDTIVPLYDADIIFAGNVFDDDVFATLSSLRSKIISDLEVRGAGLPELITINRNTTLPATVISYQLYSTSRRENELISRVNPIHPGFFPNTFIALSE